LSQATLSTLFAASCGGPVTKSAFINGKFSLINQSNKFNLFCFLCIAIANKVKSLDNENEDIELYQVSLEEIVGEYVTISATKR
jgi:hypothetical protein